MLVIYYVNNYNRWFQPSRTFGHVLIVPTSYNSVKNKCVLDAVNHAAAIVRFNFINTTT